MKNNVANYVLAIIEIKHKDWTPPNQNPAAYTRIMSEVVGSTEIAAVTADR